VGSLPVGMQSRDTTDLPYWPSQNMYVYKEVWVHPNIRWLWLMADLLPAAAPVAPVGFTLASTTAPDGEITIRLTAQDAGTRSYRLRTDNLRAATASRSAVPRAGGPATVEWKTRRIDGRAPWVAVVVEEGDARRRRELSGQ
jgi:hypothetical protein